MKHPVNNDIYHELGDRWYEADDDPVALLRAEAKTKNPWVISKIENCFSSRSKKEIRVLDVGCGAGFLSNDLARAGFNVTGIDLSESSLEVAKKHDETSSVDYIPANAYSLPFEDQSFSVVTCMDFLEHVEDPAAVVAEISRVLTPGGLFVFHTFNRNWLAQLIIIKGVEWFVKNTPPHMHVLNLFVKPRELKTYCQANRMNVQEVVGIAPKINAAFFKMLRTREVPKNFSFHITKSAWLGYLGTATKSK